MPNPLINTFRLGVKKVRSLTFVMHMEQHLKDLVFHLFVHLYHLLPGKCSGFIWDLSFLGCFLAGG